jgi:hypothetical protein
VSFTHVCVTLAINHRFTVYESSQKPKDFQIHAFGGELRQMANTALAVKDRPKNNFRI